MNQFLTEYFEILKCNSYDRELHFYKYPRVDDTQPHSIHLKFKFDNTRTYDSWGNGYSSDEAFGKAFMELIERYIFASYTPFEYKNVYGLLKKTQSLADISKRYNLEIKHFHPSNSNGVAIHSNKKKAIQAALFELLERHCILYSILENIPPSKKIRVDLAKDKACDLYVWDGPLNTYVVVGALQKGTGWYFSSSCSNSLDDAIKRASLEINSFLSLNESFSNISDFKIYKNDIDSFNRYHRYSGDQRIIEFLNSKSSKRIPDLNKKDFYFTQMPRPKIFKGLVDFPCVRVVNPYVQQLFFDNWDIAYLNPLLFNKNTTLPDYPHIIA